jgi:geranylgeranyl pyrophosphate synthase
MLGRLIQVSDDVTDALETPAKADWKKRGNNLPILYAMTACHGEREDFLRLSAQADDPEALAAAQKILLRSGAISYCTYKLIEFSREAQELFARIPLRRPERVARLVDHHVAPLHRLLESVGVEAPAALSLC